MIKTLIDKINELKVSKDERIYIDGIYYDVPKSIAESTIKTAPIFTLKGMKCIAKLFHIYDGDTCYFTIDLDGNPTSFKARINGIDTAEIRTKNPDIKKFGLLAKARAVELLDNKICLIECHGFGKYGRHLIDITLPHYDSMDYGTVMIDEFFALPYHGGKKATDIQMLELKYKNEFKE